MRGTPTQDFLGHEMSTEKPDAVDDASRPPGRPTLKSVGALADVSAMTVSRVLRDDPSVMPETKRRVLAAVDALGYRRDDMAWRLRAGKPAGMVGLVVSNLANPFYSQLALGVESILADQGLKVVLGNTADDVARERGLVSDFAGRRVDGLIVVSASESHAHLAPSELHGLPTVLAARPPIDAALACVLLDDYGGTRAAMDWLIGRGHTRLAFLAPRAVWTTSERLRGFQDALSDAGLPRDLQYIRVEQRDVESAQAVAEELLALPDPPTAFFCANSRNSIGAFRAQHQLPSAVSIAGFDDFDLADMLDIPIAVVTYDAQEVGRRAARMLLERISGRAGDQPPRVVLPTELRIYNEPGSASGPSETIRSGRTSDNR